MTTKELCDLILTTEAPGINQAEIDAACIERLKFICGDYGDDGARARKLLTIAAEMIELT